MKNRRYASKNRNMFAFAEGREHGRLTTPAVPPITITGTDRMEDRPHMDDLVECAFCVRFPELPCPMCFGWGFHTKSTDEELRKEVEGLSEHDMAAWFYAARLVASRRDRQKKG